MQYPPRNDAPSNDDLFQPSLHGIDIATPAVKPWRNWSQLWIALFGGPIPYAIIAYLNSKRLGLPARTRQLLIFGTLVSLPISVVVSLLVFQNLDDVRRLGTAVRFGTRIGAVALFALGYRLQRSADRLYQFSYGDEYSSLWKIGFLVVLVVGFLQNAVLGGIVYLLVNGLGE